ncbi:MAG: PilN domain-containing protein [Nannocystaceae bacterium]|nr:PilN domain-containing protein [Nannocystaceae bacterium]
MIRINLMPSKKRLAAARAAAPATSMGQFWVLGWLAGWGVLIAGGWWLLGLKDDETTALRAQAAKATTAAETIRNEIDEEGLEAKKKELEQLEAAIGKLEKKKRTPVYVMYDLATLLTDPSMDPSDPPRLDIDEAKLRRLKKEDPRADINPRWDPSGLWLHTVTENSGTLTLEGSARDASDLAEFVRRLRASGRFGRVTSPDFNRKTGNDGGDRHLDWTIAGVAVRRWN